MKKAIWTVVSLLVAVALCGCVDSNSGEGADYSIPEYKTEAGLPDSCEMRLAKVDTAYFACFENKWIEITDSASVEQLKEDLDEEEIQKVLEDLKKALEEKAAEKTRQQPSDKSEAVSSSESEEPESSSSEECTGRRCKDAVSSNSAKKQSNEESSDSEPESSNSDESSSSDSEPESSNSDESSSSDSEPESSNSDESSSSSSESMEITYAFGYALKNEPRKSKGCGKNSSLNSTGSVENGKKYNLNVSGKNRTFFITLPKNYDNTKPHKLLIANHCMGSKAEDFVHHNPDYDHPSPYYGQQELDKNGDYIFVAPQGNDNGTWNGKDDHQFVDEMITAMFDNYCVDTTRVFATGFSFGAMFTNSLAQDMQERLRAVAVYATADYNIWLPAAGTGRYDAKNLPIAWMAVHGKNDGMCNYDRAKNSALPRILKRNGKADANGNFTDASSEKPQEFNGNAGHLCYDFKTVDERFPVKFCSWNGEHQWTAHDGPNTKTGQGWQNTWVPEEVRKFFEQF